MRVKDWEQIALTGVKIRKRVSPYIKRLWGIYWNKLAVWQVSFILFNINYFVLLKQQFLWSCSCHFLSTNFFLKLWTAWKRNFCTNILWPTVDQQRPNTAEVRQQLWRCPTPRPCSEKHQLQQVAEGCIKPGFEYLRSQKLHNFSGNLFHCWTTPKVRKKKKKFLCLHGISCMNVPVKYTLSFFNIFEIFILSISGFLFLAHS